MLSNFNFCIFKPPQPIFDHFLSILASFFKCYIFLLIFFYFFYFFIFFLCGDPKMSYNKVYVLFKHCCYYFVRWTVYHLSVCRKVNRQYKYNLTCTLHYHRRPYRWTKIRQYFTENWKIITGNATITNDLSNVHNPSAFNRELKNNYCKCHIHRRPSDVPQSVGISQRVEK
jgi:hypothetical protein